mgnify:FL=1
MYIHRNVFILPILLIFFFLHLSCTEEPYEIPEADRTPPHAIILSPIPGQSVSGNVDFTARVTDNDLVDSVQFYIQSVSGEQVHVGTDITSENELFTYIWETENYIEDETYTLSVIAYDPTENSYAPSPIWVIVDNEDNVPPTAVIINPINGQLVSGIVDIKVEASDNGSIKSVSCYVDDGFLGNGIFIESSQLYVRQWNTLIPENGEDLIHSIYVTVTDTNDNVTTVPSIGVIVDNFDPVDVTPPTGAIIYPPPGMTVSDTINVTVTANDDVAMGKVKFFIDGDSVWTESTDTDSSGIYEYLWDTTQESDDIEHIIGVILSDSSGNETILNPISVLVDNQINDTTPPVGTITNPISGQTVSDTVRFKIWATDNYGIDGVVFFIDGDLLGVDLTADSTNVYEYSWDTSSLENGSQHTLSAQVFDLAENVTHVQPIMVTISN